MWIAPLSLTVREVETHPSCLHLRRWKSSLQQVSLLTVWNLPTTTQLTTESVPANAAKGSDVLLHVHKSPENLQGYQYKGESVVDSQQIALFVITTQETRPGTVNSGRETIYHNGSLLLQNVAQKDTGFYTLQILTGDIKYEDTSVQLHLLDGPDTPITSPESHFLPGANLSLSCHAASHPPVQYSWLFNGRPQSSTQELFIPNVTANNDRIYTCLVHNSATGLSRTTVKNILVLGVWIAET
uniref:Ig-like domain-containing protein n=1 Tax=Castor canadensis TaxID=51338 RepID=A0A8C0WD47_CASCN